MNVVPDPAAAVALFVPFLVAVFGLWTLLWSPLLAYMDERQHASEHARHEAHRLGHEADERMARIAANLEGAEAAARSARQLLRASALTEEARVVGEARAEADRRVSLALTEIRDAADAAARALRSQATNLAGDIAARTLGRGEA
jgi:F0F1-type ATP synthase membrane subunit b/b'